MPEENSISDIYTNITPELKAIAQNLYTEEQLLEMGCEKSSVFEKHYVFDPVILKEENGVCNFSLGRNGEVYVFDPTEVRGKDALIFEYKERGQWGVMEECLGSSGYSEESKEILREFRVEERWIKDLPGFRVFEVDKEGDEMRGEDRGIELRSRYVLEADGINEGLTGIDLIFEYDRNGRWKVREDCQEMVLYDEVSMDPGEYIDEIVRSIESGDITLKAIREGLVPLLHRIRNDG